jgi:class 3 adenylate cyclase/tetratricopeptide (TPR) repeat protein
VSQSRSGLVAVLFTDLVGSTELMWQLGDRAFDELRRAHFAALGRAVAAHGGEEVKNTGDGIMAVFPSAAEAVEAAVAMQQAAARQANNRPVAIRVGVAVGDATLEGGDYFGTPVVEAARLVAAARPGQILATAVVRTLAGNRCTVAFTDLAPFELKGLPAPVPACDVAWEQLPASAIPMPALLTDIGRVFVGREGDLERLSQLWKEVATGERRLALLAGEPGVGKTRLAAELAVRVHDEGATVLVGRCDEDLGVPYQPFVEALRHFVDHTSTEELAGCLGRYGGELARLVPELIDVPNLQSPLKSDPETERYRLFDAVAAWLAAASFEEPILLLLDDLQWAAKPTLLLLRHVVRSSEPIRVLVLSTYRDSELAHDHPLVEVLADLRRHEGVQRLSLSGLDQAAVANFMAQAAGHEMDDEGLALARAIHTETEGNPFFVREVIRHLIETGAVEHREGRWATRLPLEELGIPESVRDVVGRRLSRLSEEANQALRVAAVVGVEFELPVVQAAGGLDEETLLSALEETAQARLTIEATSARYRFAHALVHDTLYGQLSTARQVTLHRKVAEAIEGVHAARLDDHLPALAHHWSRASAPAADTAKAVEYATRAGDRALAQLAPEEAARWYGQTLELHDVAGGSRELGAELLIRLGEAQRQAGQVVFRQTLLDAARVARDLGDTDRLVRAALANNRGLLSEAGAVDRERVEVLEAALVGLRNGDSASRARVLALLAEELIGAGDWPRRLDLADEALLVARRLGDEVTLARVLNLRNVTTHVPGMVDRRLAESAESLELTARLGDPLERYWALAFRLHAVSEAGELGEVDGLLAGMDTLARELSQPGLRWFVTFHRSWRELLAGRIDEADRLALEALQIGNDTGQPDALSMYALQLWSVRLYQGRLAELAPLLRQAVVDNPGIPAFGAVLAHTLVELGDTDEAGQLLAAGKAHGFKLPYDPGWWLGMACYAEVCSFFADESAAAALTEELRPLSGNLVFHVVGNQGAFDRYLGLLSAVLGRFDEAESYFRAAAQVHERIGAPACLARTRLDWARMLLTRRGPSDAERVRDLLDQALHSARELGLANIERRAVELLEELP